MNNLPEWQNTGVEPPASLKVSGWQQNDRPPAQYFNWWMNRTYLALVAAKAHVDSRANPHAVTKTQVGLGNVSNVLQASKTEFDNHVQSILHTFYAVGTGTNNVSLTIPTFSGTSLVAGQSFRFKNPNANTGNVTLRINNITLKPVLRPSGMQLSAGTLKAGGVYTVCYDGVNFILQGEGGEYGTVESNHVIEGRTFGTENGVMAGKIPVLNTFEKILQAGENHFIPYGLHDGRSMVRAASLASQTVGNVLQHQVLAGRTGWVGGNKFTGTMPDYSRAAIGNNYVTALSVNVDAIGNLVVEPPTGYYESGRNVFGFGTILSRESNLLASNIVAGKRIFNLLGTAIVGKRVATGTGWTMAGTNGQLSVTGLAFKPSIVITKLGTNAGQLYGSVHALQTAFSSGASGKLDATIMGGSTANGEFTSLSNGFTVKANLMGEYPVHWLAIE